MFFSKNVFMLSLILSGCIEISGCTDSSSSDAGTDFNDGIVDQQPTNTDFDKHALISSLINNVYVPVLDEFQQSSAQQVTSIQNYCNDLTVNQSENSLLKSEAQSAWVSSMNTWQQLELMQIGPLSDNESELKNAIYSWPVTNQCAVDQDVGNFESGTASGGVYDITKRTATRRGLDALEYLLFSPSMQHSCSLDSYAPDNWNDRSIIERQIARCEFAQEVASDINNSALSLQQAWLEENGFKQTLLNAGADNNAFEDHQAALNKMTDAMFYLDNITKDSKLAAPIGLMVNSCDNAACVDAVESHLSSNTINNIKANLIAFQRLFFAATMNNEVTDLTNENDIGFDDYLIAVEAEDLAATMKIDIQSAIDLIDAFEGSFSDTVINDPDKIQQLHQAVKKVTDNLKSSFITYLSLSLPLTSAGDAD